jgi:CSLREA domain-containing protein
MCLPLVRLGFPVAALLCVASFPVHAGSGIIVTTAVDVVAADGLCSLREAIINANHNDQSGSVDCAAGSLDPIATDTIFFDPGLAGAVIALNGTALPTITQALDIVGPVIGDAAGLVLDGGETSRIFTVQGATPSAFLVRISGLTLRHGRTSGSQEHGGALRASGADLELNQVHVLDSVTLGLQAFGGGVAVIDGFAQIEHSRIANNTTHGTLSAGGGLAALGGAQLLRSSVTGNRTRGSDARGGGIIGGGHTSLIESTVSANVTEAGNAHGGGIAVVANDLVLVNSTVSGNRVDGAGAEGGGIWVGGGSSTLVHATLALNAASAGGVAGLFNALSGAGDAIVLHNSVLAQDRDGELACSAPAATHSGTLATDTGCTGVATAWTEIGLAALGDHAGPTPTHALAADSAAIGIGGDCNAILLIDRDQRGQPRPGTGATDCDAGAFEFQPPLCVTSSAELQSALTFAATNGIDDEIRIAVGHYPAPGNGFLYTIQVANGDEADITLSGGWTTLGNDPCGQLGSQSPFDTVLDGGGAGRVMSIVVRGHSDVHVSRLSFVDGLAPGGGGSGGLTLTGTSQEPYRGAMVVERNAFIGSQAEFAGGLSVFSGAFAGDARFVVSGNVFLDNHASDNWGAASVAAFADPGGVSGESGLFLIGNTALFNGSDAGGDPVGGIYVGAAGDIRRVVANNLLWGNDGADLLMAGADGYELLHNNLGERSGFEPGIDFGNLSVAPQFEPCAACDDLVPASGSALIDAGLVPDGNAGWSLPALDLRGEVRVRGQSVEIGAWENGDHLFADGFESD